MNFSSLRSLHVLHHLHGQARSFAHASHSITLKKIILIRACACNACKECNDVMEKSLHSLYFINQVYLSQVYLSLVTSNYTMQGGFL